MARAPQAQQAGGLPPSKFIHFHKFTKMNTKLARQNLPEDQAGWLENLQPIGDNKLTTVNGSLPTLATLTSENVVRQFDANIGNVDYIINFTQLGACIAVNVATGVKTTVAGDGTFSTAPDMTVYSSARILIQDATKGYATWDGTLFVGSGGVSPNIQVTNGGTFAATPAVAISGGSGVGATAHAVMGGSGASQFVAQVVLDNPGTGYLPGDTLTVTFTPASTAAATARVWPQVKGTSIDVFAGRVWWINGRILNFTGTAGFDDTNPANAAGSTTLVDRDLTHTITAVRNLNNYLYIFGDQSIRQIGSITVQSSITLFTILTLASDIGTSFLMTIKSYNRLVLFANKNGVYGIFGATVQKISDDLDGIFQLTDFSLQPSSALADLNNIHCYIILLKYLDPISGSRSILAIFQSSKWFIVSQGNSLVSICSISLASTTQVETFGSSGPDVTQLLQGAVSNIAIFLRTALSNHGSPVTAKQVLRAGVLSTTQSPVTLSMVVESENSSNTYSLSISKPVIWVNNLNQVVQFQNNSSQNVNFAVGGFQFPYTSVDGYGKFLGMQVKATVNAPLDINGGSIEYYDADVWGQAP